MENSDPGSDICSEEPKNNQVPSSQLQCNQEIQLDVINSIKDGFALWDTNDKLIICNEQFQIFFTETAPLLKPGVKYQKFITAACNAKIFSSPDGSSKGFIADRIKRHANQSPAYEEKLSNGRWILINERPTSQQRTVSIITDITAQKEIQFATKTLAETDSLTGLFNRTRFNEQLKETFNSSLENSQMFGVLILDIDFFKSINDTRGHLAGDALLVEVADRLRNCVKPTDIIARLGGDEFAIIVPDIDAQTDLDELANNITNALSEIYKFESIRIQTSASTGIAVFPIHNHSPEDLFKNADIALYKAKEQGRNQYKRYDDDLHLEAEKHRKIEQELQIAIREKQLELFYQPQIDITSGKIIGAEALIRWRHEKMGMVSPADFIPIAEATNLMAPLGEWIIETACKQAKAWQVQGLPNIVVAINISPSQFKHRDLPLLIADTLAKNLLAPEWLEVEVTEGIAMELDCQYQFEKIKDMGVSIAIDDFGTGYSSLSQLINFSIDRLKIDRSFVTSINTNPERKAIFSAIVNMAETLKINVIAEGIETQDELITIRDLGCREAQGFLFSPALPANAFAHFLSANHSQKGNQKKNFPVSNKNFKYA